MPALKDHYKTLGVPVTGTLQDIKEAYRKLAFKYHPDKNADNDYAAAFFMELHEAYLILSNPNKRKIYDEERWLNGMEKRMHEHAITPQWLLKESTRLQEHMRKIDTYRMSHLALSEYILMLLSDAHMAVLLRDNETEVNANIVDQLLASTQKLQIEHLPSILQRLVQLAGSDNTLLDKISDYARLRKRQAGRDKYFPAFIIAIAILLAIFMYFYGRK